MRDIPDQPFAGWDPPDYRVDEQGKLVGALPGTPNNWDRFGGDDQIGTANFLTPERVAAAAALVRTGKRFTLGSADRSADAGWLPRRTAAHVQLRGGRRHAWAVAAVATRSKRPTTTS